MNLRNFLVRNGGYVALAVYAVVWVAMGHYYLWR